MRYGQGEDYPYHMPGHKRRLCGDLPPSLFQMDITEIDGFDNLHEPEGLIAALQDRIAHIYGARKSYCLVGSSTAGILSAVSFAVPMNGHILMARNCHKSAYHAAYLRRLKISYLYPKVLEGYGIADGISARQVAEALSQEKDIDAVLVVSPTYEGRISPIREIARVTHQYGKMLIVDEAHGAHLVLAGDTDDRTIDQANSNGQACCDTAGDTEEDKPDLVIQSIHKTLPALTQTAVLHVYGRRVDLALLERYLHIYQSSSPSYVLMAGVDNCFTILERRGRELYREFKRRFHEMVEELKHCRFIRILATGCAEGEAYSPARQDVGKLLLYPHPQMLTGQQLYDLLREEYHLQLEMAAREFCLAMFTIGDTQEGFDRMRNAVLELDGRLAMMASGKVRLHKAETQDKEQDKEQDKGPNIMTGADIEPNEGKESIEIKGPNESNVEKFGVGEFLTGVDDFERDQTAEAEIGIPLGEAWDLPNEEVALTAAEGRISADFINLYPPGTPILAPGERFTKRICDYLLKCHAQGLRIQGLDVEDSAVKCKVIK